MLDGKIPVVRIILQLILSSKGASVRRSTVRSSTKNTMVIETWSRSWWDFGKAGPPQKVHQNAKSGCCSLR